MTYNVFGGTVAQCNPLFQQTFSSSSCLDFNERAGITYINTGKL